MQTLLFKLKTIFVPYLIISVLFIIVYTAIHWLVSVHFGVLLTYEIIFNTFAPLLFCWLPFRFLMFKRFQCFKQNIALIYIMLAGFTIFFPLVLMQDYMKKSTSKLTKLEYPSQIFHQPPTVLNTIEHYYTDKSRALYTFHRNVVTSDSGKDKRKELELYVCYDLVLMDSPVDTIMKNPAARMEFSYTKNIAYNLPKEDEDKQIAAFKAKCKNDFDKESLTGFSYFEGVDNINRQAAYESDKAVNPNAKIPDYYLYGRRGDIAENNQHFLIGIINIYSFSALVFLILLLFPKVNTNYLNRNTEDVDS